MSSIITFAANNDLFRRRKRVYRACEECKRKRKRCTHTFDAASASTDSASKEAGQALKRIRRASEDPEVDNRHEGSAGRPSSAPNCRQPKARSESPARFLGHLNPEGVLREQPSEDGKKVPENECGYWEPPRQSRGSLARLGTGLIEPGDDPDVEAALRTYLAAINYSILPPKTHLTALVELFFQSIQVLLPIIDVDDFRSRSIQGTESTLLKQAICLIASKHDSAGLHLYLGDSPILLSCRDFERRLYRSIEATLNARLEKDRIIVIQVLILLSMYVEGTDGAERASMHLSLAIHHAHTIGMQFGRGRSDARSEYFHRLFWCLTSLDVLNAARHARPMMMHTRDNRLENPISRPETRYTPFGMWLQLSEALDKAIWYYRPNIDERLTGWEDGFPSFEEIIGDKADSLEPAIIAALELYYHTVAMVSHRSRGINKAQPATASSVRQTLSAARVILILSKECPSNLPPLPVIPYALSISMSVAYRAFRQTKVLTHKERAREDLKTCCELLEKFQKAWWSAGAMAELGRAALRKAANSSRKKERAAAAAAAAASMPNANDQIEALPAQTQQNDADHANEAATTLTSLAYPQTTPQTSPEQPLPPVLDTYDPSGMQPYPMDPTQPFLGFDLAGHSPDWLNFDNAFENFDLLLGSSGADLSIEMLKPFGDGGYGFETGGAG